MIDIFISYAREDRNKVKHLAENLESQGWSTWWDWRIPVGKSWRRVIADSIENSRCILVIWSKHSTNKDWVLEEAEYAQKKNIYVPAMIDKIDLPLGFGQIHAADLTDWQMQTNHIGFSNLLNAIAAILGPLTIGLNNDSEQNTIANKEQLDSRSHEKKKTNLFNVGKKAFDNRKWDIAADNFERLLQMDRSNEKARQLLTEAKKSNNKIKRLRQKIAAAEKDYDYEKAESFAIKLLNLVADETPIKAKIRLYRKKKAQQKQSMLEVDKEIQEIQTMIDDYKKKYPDTPSPSFSVYEAPYNYLFKNTINDENDIHSPSKLVLRSQKFKPKPDNDKGPLSQFTMLLFFEVLIFIAIALFWGLF